nr:MAG TPA: hypothetical protein [Caudoviricetes sp.]
MIRFIFTPCLPGGPQGFFNDSVADLCLQRKELIF